MKKDDTTRSDRKASDEQHSAPSSSTFHHFLGQGQPHVALNSVTSPRRGNFISRQEVLLAILNEAIALVSEDSSVSPNPTNDDSPKPDAAT
jgi:hypothetical protein